MHTFWFFDPIMAQKVCIAEWRNKVWFLLRLNDLRLNSWLRNNHNTQNLDVHQLNLTPQQ